MMKNLFFYLYCLKLYIKMEICILFPSIGTYHDFREYKNHFSVTRYKSKRNKLFNKVNKMIRKKQIKVRFLVTDGLEWCFDNVYKKFEEIGADVKIIVTPFFNGDIDAVLKIYRHTVEYFQDKNLAVLDLYGNTMCSLGKIPEEAKGDIVIYTNPWMGAFPDEFKIDNLPLSTLTYYVPYGFTLMKMEQNQFNQPSHNLFTGIFCETAFHKKLFKKFCKTGDEHVFFSGRPKMDVFYEKNNIEENLIWRKATKNNVIKIIYSPHWTVKNVGEKHFSTFCENASFMLKYARNHVETTSWVFKPHPLLEGNIEKSGIMTKEEYLRYVDEWNHLPNGSVYTREDYQELLASSDCIINDSVSFIAEYMYVDKPMLFLASGENEFNAFGEECMKNVYTCKGDDFKYIQYFIEEIVKKNDYLQSLRQSFYNEYLDYMTQNGCKAEEFISRHIIGKVYGEK